VDLNRARHQQGQKQTKTTKFTNGICLFFVLLCVIWAPMLVRNKHPSICLLVKIKNKIYYFESHRILNPFNTINEMHNNMRMTWSEKDEVNTFLR